MKTRFNLICFKTMDEAYDNILKLKQNGVYNGEVILSYEYLSCGSRYFIVITYKFFLSFYLKLEPLCRCWYEILLPNLFCKLYFDIEYDKNLNSQQDWFNGFKFFMKQLNKYLYCKSKINCILFGEKYFAEKIADGEYIIMDASNEHKFSRHIILHLYKIILFRNQFEVKKFVLDFNSYLMTIYALKSDEVADIIINHKSNDGHVRKTFIDINVYRSRQQFRILGSSKCKDYGRRPLNLMTSMVSCNSNISNFDYAFFIKSVISFKEDNIHYERFLYNVMQRDNPVLNKNIAVSSQIMLRPPTHFDPIYDYPKVVLYFIKTMPAPWNKSSVRIKNVYYMGNKKTVFIITLFNTKYCINIKREHKSNNIYFVVKPNLCGFTQKCTNCKNYESYILKLNNTLFLTSKKEKEMVKYKNIRNTYNL